MVLPERLLQKHEPGPTRFPSGLLFTDAISLPSGSSPDATRGTRARAGGRAAPRVPSAVDYVYVSLKDSPPRAVAYGNTRWINAL